MPTARLRVSSRSTGGSEAYRFDKGWAQQDTNCKKRIEAYDKGDVQALEAPVLTPAASDSVSSPGVPPASATTPPTNPGVDPPSRTWQAVGIQNCTVARFSYVLSPADTVVTVLPGQTVYQTVGEGNLLIAFDSSYADDLQKKTYLLKGAVGRGHFPARQRPRPIPSLPHRATSSPCMPGPAPNWRDQLFPIPCSPSNHRRLADGPGRQDNRLHASVESRGPPRQRLE